MFSRRIFSLACSKSSRDAILILFKSPKLLSFFGVAFGDASKRTFVDHPSDYGEEEEIDEDELIGWEEV